MILLKIQKRSNGLGESPVEFYLSTKLKAQASNPLRTTIYKAAHNAQCVSKQLPCECMIKNVNGYLTRKIFELLHNQGRVLELALRDVLSRNRH